jgi:4-hydroxy-3-polyprenylbenzoate decarboxylase
MTKPVVIGMTGASGAVYGLRLLELLGELDIDTYLVASRPGAQVLEHETGKTLDDAKNRASSWFESDDLFAPIASGSFLTRGMIIAPCSIRTLSAVASSRSSNLVERAADVTLKQRRPLVLMVRETPLHVGHLKQMTRAAEAGATIMPPVPAFYQRPRSLEQIISETAARALDLLGIEHNATARWGTTTDA